MACADITPPSGVAMAGFAARSGPALGAHDALTVRVLAVGDTALLVADVIGIDAAMAARIRARAGDAATPGRVMVAATHTHGGPASMAGRLGTAPDPDWAQTFEDTCVATLRAARVARRPARLSMGQGGDPGIARNRRSPGGPVDPALPVLWAHDAAGRAIAVLTGHACHPVVLGADNRLWTADYPHFVRAAIEAACPGVLAIWVTGCAGDINTGHSAAASLSLAPDPARSFAEASRIGECVAYAALAARTVALDDSAGAVAAAATSVDLAFASAGPPSDAEIAAWRADCADAAPVRAALLRHWIAWAEGPARRSARSLSVPVSVLEWGGALLLGLPGEIFAITALDLRAALPVPVVTVGYAGDNPGYIPPRAAFAEGGYEVDEAHRFYGQPAAFAPGSAEAVAGAAADLARRLIRRRPAPYRIETI